METNPPLGLYNHIKRDREACISLKAALLIQNWYRRHQAELEVRRRCAWKIYEFFEYSGADDQRHLKEFFTWILSSYGSPTPPKPFSLKSRSEIKNSFSHQLERGLQKINLAGKSDPRRQGSSLRMTDKSNSNHSRYTSEYIRDLIAFQKQGKLIDADLVLEVLEEATAILQEAPNIQRVSTTLSKRVTILGDLHGQVDDLLLIFNKNGLPDVFNPYIFNGDFVDRGSHSTEVLIILLVCLIAHPSAVFLNRGNHEDPIVNKRYGFADEVRSKYPKQFKKIQRQAEQFFCVIPLCALVDDVILVCHGGISRSTDLAKIAKLDRKKFSSVLQPQLEGEGAVSIDDWRQILDVLWSDPQAAFGCKPNLKRGGGSYFGYDITAKFLSPLKIGLLIRSHECCPRGWKLDHHNQVLTVFSASNYYGSDSNLGAFIQLTSRRVLGNSNIESKISIAEPFEEEMGSVEGDAMVPLASRTTFTGGAETVIAYSRVVKQADLGTTASETSDRRHIIDTLLLPRIITFRTGMSKRQSMSQRRHSDDGAYRMLVKKISSKKNEILCAMHECDPQRIGEVTISEWCAVMVKTADPNLPWRILRHTLVQSSKINPKTHVLYLSMFDPKHSVFSTNMKRKCTSEFYSNADELAAVFKLFDFDDTGFVSVKTFKEKCLQLYSNKGVQCSAVTISKLASLLDFNNDGIIDFNEFIEGSRLVKENYIDAFGDSFNRFFLDDISAKLELNEPKQQHARN